MLWVVLVTIVVTILRFTITPTTAVVCFRLVLFCGSIVLMQLHGRLLVLVTVSAVVTILGLPLIIAITAMVILKSVGGVLYLTFIPSFWLDDVSMMSPALLNDVDRHHINH
jgi:hypothetical protein